MDDLNLNRSERTYAGDSDLRLVTQMVHSVFDGANHVNRLAVAYVSDWNDLEYPYAHHHLYPYMKRSKTTQLRAQDVLHCVTECVYASGPVLYRKGSVHDNVFSYYFLRCSF